MRPPKKARPRPWRILALYREFCESELAIPVLSGRKSLSEKFAGASMTYAIEALMSDGKALQMGTSHNLGQHFSKAFDIKFEDRNQTLQYVWQTSWGMTTRTIGALIMVHGDDSGLRFPPRIAPVQVMVVPISIGNWKETVLPAAEAVAEGLRKAGLRAAIDAREEATPGWKFSEYEMRGVPLRIEIGPRDVKAGQAVLVRRDTKAKETVPLASLGARVPALLDEIQAGLLAQARDLSRSEHPGRGRLRQLQGHHREQARLRPGRLVRRRGLRGQDQGRDDGHDPGHPSRRQGRQDRRALRGLRRQGTGPGLFRPRLLKREDRHWTATTPASGG